MINTNFPDLKTIKWFLLSLLHTSCNFFLNKLFIKNLCPFFSFLLSWPIGLTHILTVNPIPTEILARHSSLFRRRYIIPCPNRGWCTPSPPAPRPRGDVKKLLGVFLFVGDTLWSWVISSPTSSVIISGPWRIKWSDLCCSTRKPGFFLNSDTCVLVLDRGNVWPK